jgi:signal transduction histidine kinase
LLAIAALTVIVCGAAITAILLLAQTTLDERRAHARDNVAREVERLRAVVDEAPMSRGSRGRVSGELQSGYLAAATMDKGPLVADAIARAQAAGDLAVVEGTDDGGAPLLVAAMPARRAGYVYATQRVVAGRETRGLRTVVVVLALLTLLLVVASLRTLGTVERDVRTLRASLAALGKDLRAPVGEPALRELGEVAAGVASMADELRRAQEERERLTQDLADRERLAALGRVAAGIAHEVRNPLASMKLRADLARTGGEATPAVAKDLEDIATEIARLDRLVSDLLFVAGRRTGPRALRDVGALVQKRASLLAPWAAERGVTVVADGAAEIALDEDALARAVDNLLRNAVEASPRGARVEARVAASTPDGSGGAGDAGGTRAAGARIVVTDRGPGVPPDRVDELFEPFFTTKPDGTGLGLALARAVAAAHGGALTYAREGEVTRFTLTLGVG